ncbi:unnamed protein product [Blepharisma stoltei]|uniref:Uncharacterized protein n=1 Tax=Blepharisma stoltei TaxID=1481888 RepID=A0AAU9JEF1_9CILI|nr:unnamed protein product [Blepharisma stoltei]
MMESRINTNSITNSFVLGFPSMLTHKKKINKTTPNSYKSDFHLPEISKKKSSTNIDRYHKQRSFPSDELGEKTLSRTSSNSTQPKEVYLPYIYAQCGISAFQPEIINNYERLFLERKSSCINILKMEGTRSSHSTYIRHKTTIIKT